MIRDKKTKGEVPFIHDNMREWRANDRTCASYQIEAVMCYSDHVMELAITLSLFQH